MDPCYPLSVEDERELPEGYAGPVFVWDIDKTYLATHFSSLKGLARIPIEFAVDKIAVPGMPEILRGLRRGAGPGFACAPLYFVSASPPQLRRVLEHKMLLDGVEFDGITTKDWLKTLRALRPDRLRDHVGFKLCALLSGRQRRPWAKEYLFGDDVEQDAAAFHLYAQILHKEISAGDAEVRMKAEGVRRDDRRCVFSLAARLPVTVGRVKRIFINLTRNTPPAEFARFADLVVPVKGASQLGLALYELGLVDIETVRQAFEAVAGQGGLSGESLQALVADARSRGLISAERAHALGM